MSSVVDTLCGVSGVFIVDNKFESVFLRSRFGWRKEECRGKILCRETEGSRYCNGESEDGCRARTVHDGPLRGGMSWSVRASSWRNGEGSIGW